MTVCSTRDNLVTTIAAVDHRIPANKHNTHAYYKLKSLGNTLTLCSGDPMKLEFGLKRVAMAYGHETTGNQ